MPADLCGGTLKLATGSTFVIGYNEYHDRLGVPLPYTKKWIETGVLTNPLPTDIGAHTTVFEPLTHVADAGAGKSAAKASPARPLPSSPLEQSPGPGKNQP